MGFHFILIILIVSLRFIVNPHIKMSVYLLHFIFNNIHLMFSFMQKKHTVTGYFLNVIAIIMANLSFGNYFFFKAMAIILC